MTDHPPSLSDIRLGPATLHGVIVVLRPPRIADYAQWRRIRLRDQRTIEPFWTSSPLDWAARHSGKQWVRECLVVRTQARAGRRLSTVIEVAGRFAGQIELVSIAPDTGSAELGLWVDADMARHGFGGLAASLILDFAFGAAGLQRLTAPISPANIATSRGAALMGFRREAMMTRYFDVGGARRDHELWAITREAVPPNGFTARWITRYDGPVSAAPATPSAPEGAPIPATIVLVATARYYAGRVLHMLDPLRTPKPIRLTDAEHPALVLRSRRRGDWAQWCAARMHSRGRLDPGPGESEAAWAARHSRSRWWRELLRARAGLHSPTGLVLAIEVDGAYFGEGRLFDLDMFDRNAKMFVWTDTTCAEPTRVAATQLLLDYAFAELGLCRVETAIELDDLGAAEVAARVGMIREGRMHSYVGATGRRADHDLWAVTTPTDQSSRGQVSEPDVQ
ncbi:GNAT family N-acetyltransferase [Nocardia sp. NBC_01009]|uniref:GNAT family N-acetyltransferase n=1 Tax=Nocardia sp. NBC_01009 TaxID=2975996 RepID=UPI00386A85F3|nr:GNAT family N-acetyltransferase [Nocardia sp. NBC_01009]